MCTHGGGGGRGRAAAPRTRALAWQFWPVAACPRQWPPCPATTAARRHPTPGSHLVQVIDGDLGRHIVKVLGHVLDVKLAGKAPRTSPGGGVKPEGKGAREGWIQSMVARHASQGRVDCSSMHDTQGDNRLERTCPHHGQCRWRSPGRGGCGRRTRSSAGPQICMGHVGFL